MSSLRFSEKALDKFIDLQLMADFEANRPQPQQSRYEDSFDYQSDLSEWTRDQFRWVDSERGNARRALLAHLLAAEGKDFRKALMWELIREFHGEDAFIRALPESPSDKREILNQWLAAEGLPGVEEIEGLREQLADAEAAASGMSRDLTELGENAESTIDKLMADLKDAQATLKRQSESHADEVRLKLKYYQKTREQAKQIQRLEQLRQSRIHELLEAEARERVEITSDEWSNERVKVDGRDVTINYAYGRVFLIDHEAEELDPKTAEDYDRLSLAFAALAEKRRREGEANNGDI